MVASGILATKRALVVALLNFRLEQFLPIRINPDGFAIALNGALLIPPDLSFAVIGGTAICKYAAGQRGTGDNLDSADNRSVGAFSI